jgi:hypothetical protein
MAAADIRKLQVCFLKSERSVTPDTLEKYEQYDKKHGTSLTAVSFADMSEITDEQLVEVDRICAD